MIMKMSFSIVTVHCVMLMLHIPLACFPTPPSLPTYIPLSLAPPSPSLSFLPFLPPTALSPPVLLHPFSPPPSLLLNPSFLLPSSPSLLQCGHGEEGDLPPPPPWAPVSCASSFVHNNLQEVLASRLWQRGKYGEKIRKKGPSLSAAITHSRKERRNRREKHNAWKANSTGPHVSTEQWLLSGRGRCPNNLTEMAYKRLNSRPDRLWRANKRRSDGSREFNMEAIHHAIDRQLDGAFHRGLSGRRRAPSAPQKLSEIPCSREEGFSVRESARLLIS